MVENYDVLLAMAEIAAAFAGFAALVSVLRRGAGQVAGAIHDLLRLRLVISSSVAGVAAALVPVGLAGYGLEPALTWQLAALIFLIFDNSIIGSFLGAYKPVKGTFPPDRVAVVLVSALELVEQGSLLAVLFAVPIGNPAALYVTALIANLCQVGFIFIRFVGSAFHPDNEAIVEN